jgi:anti-anti-sigma factor
VSAPYAGKDLDAVTTPIIVELQGEYDVTRREELDHLLDRYGDIEPLAFDMHAVHSVDTSTIRSLVRFQRARKEAGRMPIVLLKPSSAVLRFIEKAQLDSAFEIRESI